VSARAAVLLAGWARRPLEELVPVQQATADLAAVRARLDLAEAQSRALDGREEEVRALDASRQQLVEEQARLRECLRLAAVRAPGPGVVLTPELQRREGDAVQRGEVLMEVAGEEGWVAKVVVDEGELPRVELGQRARLYARAFPHMEYRLFGGRVTAVARQPQPGRPGYAVEVEVEDPVVSDGERQYCLADGMTVTAQIVVESGRITSVVRRRLLRHLDGARWPRVYRARDRGGR
ncbi:MAG: HlyD family efflux transporter periplasmic adaptor subunit, partial [Gemmatimonadota bacterium]